jgi:hypothetical protein
MPAGKRRELIEKIRRLAADTLAEVEEFVDFLRQAAGGAPAHEGCDRRFRGCVRKGLG